MNKGLKKHILSSGKPSEWDLNAHWVALGYRSSVQASTGFSPYEMLLGLDPVVPLAQREDWGEEVDYLDNWEKAYESWDRRGMRMKSHCLATGGNLKIAQHSLRSSRSHSAAALSVIRRFKQPALSR
jgi:hypothetical protein